MATSRRVTVRMPMRIEDPDDPRIADYRHLKGDIAEFKDYLRSGPDFDDLDLTRTTERPRSTDWENEG